MASVEFILNGNQVYVPCSFDEKMEDIINRYKIKVNCDLSSAQFLYGGNNLNLESTFSNQANSIDKERKIMSVLVIINKSSSSINEGIIKSKEVICPECKESCLIDIQNYKVNLHSCKNGHSKYNISLKEFDKLQMINENEIKCNMCNNSKYNSYNKQFYFCLK